MINLRNVKKYCKDFTKIENYDKAIADTTQVWECHHILEQVFTGKQLIVGGNYYDVEPEELIFLTRKEHRKIKHKGDCCKCKGKKHSEETKAKMSAAMKGKKNPMYGKKQAFSEESKAKMSASHTGKHWRLENGKRVYY